MADSNPNKYFFKLPETPRPEPIRLMEERVPGYQWYDQHRATTRIYLRSTASRLSSFTPPPASQRSMRWMLGILRAQAPTGSCPMKTSPNMDNSYGRSCRKASLPGTC
jgi:hypothetical protein